MRTLPTLVTSLIRSTALCGDSDRGSTVTGTCSSSPQLLQKVFTSRRDYSVGAKKKGAAIENMSVQVLEYLNGHAREHEVLRDLRIETSKMNGSHMQISPEQGQFMAMMVKLLGAERYLEVGVFTGYSLIAAAMALPKHGKAVALDRDEKILEIAKEYVEKANVQDKVEYMVGNAVESLKSVMETYGENSFDMAFIDADKKQYMDYYESMLKIVKPGGLIVIDNVLWGGKVADPEASDNTTQYIRDLNSHLLQDDRIDYNMIGLRDGVALCRKRPTN